MGVPYMGVGWPAMISRFKSLHLEKRISSHVMIGDDEIV